MLNALKSVLGAGAVAAAISIGASVGAQSAGLSKPIFDVPQGRTALLVADPKDTTFGPQSAPWGLLDRKYMPQGGDANIDQLLVTASVSGVPIFVSPHYFIPQVQELEFGEILASLVPSIGFLNRSGHHAVADLRRTGLSWRAQIRESVEGKGAAGAAGNVYWPEAGDLVQQLREQGIEEVIIAGVFASRSTEAQARELAAQGFTVLVVSDATADGMRPSGHFYHAVFGNVANTSAVIKTMQSAAGM